MPGGGGFKRPWPMLGCSLIEEKEEGGRGGEEEYIKHKAQGYIPIMWAG